MFIKCCLNRSYFMRIVLSLLEGSHNFYVQTRHGYQISIRHLLISMIKVILLWVRKSAREYTQQDPQLP